MVKRIAITGLVLVVLGLGGATMLGTGLDLARARAEAAVYRDRLAELSEAHAGLVDRYNVAVRRTAVTELVVRPAEGEAVGGGAVGGGGAPSEADSAAAPSLAVRIRSVDGVEREIATPFDPRREIYVDFVVRDGRVLIRRIFDDRTPPSDGLLIDGSMGALDWEREDLELGKAVYRSLRPGRWTVSVNGSGAIDLVWSGPVDAPPAALAASAAVDEFDEIEIDVRDARRSVGLGELWRVLVGRGGDGEGADGDPAAETVPPGRD